MAESSTGSETLLAGSDPVADKLLSHVSLFVIGPVRKQFATGPLGLRDVEYDNIEEDHSTAQRRNYEVLQMWRNKSYGETVKTFVDKLVLWQLSGYVAGQVWENIGTIVEPSILPAKLPSPTATKRWDDNYGDSVPIIPFAPSIPSPTATKRWGDDDTAAAHRVAPCVLEEDCEPGVGKSCSMAMLAMDWAEDDTTAEPITKRTRLDSDSKASLKNFDFVFLIQLSKVDSNIPLEEVIIQQHSRLKSKNVPKEQISAVLQQKKVLLLFDGYDEYKKGTSTAIDDAITNTIGNCFVIITSRPGDYMEQSDVDQLDGEIQITGLSEENIEKCATGYLQSLLASCNDRKSAENACKNLIELAEQVGIDELLRIPIILLMVCVLYSNEQSLPDTKTGIVWAIIKMCMDRSTLKHMGKKSSDIENIEDMLFILGELSWLALQRKTKQLLINKTDIEKKGFPDILKLGLLHGTNRDEATREEEPIWFTYPHKLFQDFLAGKYSSKKSIQDIKSMFKSWKDIEQKFEVFLFMCGIMEDPSPAIDHMCEQYVADTTIYNITIHETHHLFQIYKEIRSKEKFLNPFCNDHIYFVWQLPLKKQSRFYMFGRNLEWLEIGSHVGTTHMACESDTEISSCRVLINKTCLPPRDVLSAISTLRQTISWLRIYTPFELPDKTCDDIPTHIFKIDPLATIIEIQKNVVLPKAISEYLGRELLTCYNLSKLEIENQPLVAAEITDFLGTNRNLRTLNMQYCNLSGNKMKKLCEQFEQFSNLQYCYLSGNAVGDTVSVLAESIQSSGLNNSLIQLSLRDCNITAGGCSRLLQALEVCPNLILLDLSNNTIGGAFHTLSSKTMYPRLFQLDLAGTSLTSGDIKTINTLMKGNKMPGICFLYLSYVNLDNLELDTLETLEGLNSIIQKVQAVSFRKGDYYVNVKERITRILKHKSKKTTIS